jgi:hypothetical protein
MVPPTRRALLSGAAGFAGLLAGCGGPADPTTPTATGRPPATGPGSGSTTDPETLQVRAGGDRPPVWLVDPDEADGGRPTPRADDRYVEITVVDGPSRADRVAVATDAARERVDGFLEATDFDRETVVLQTVRLGECFRLELCAVSWTPNEVSTDYARHSRPYDEACGVDTRVFEARLLRLPAALDADEVNSHRSSIGSAACEARRGGGADGEGGGGTVTTAADSPTGEPAEAAETTTTTGGGL